jgi:hypothetical protein
MSDEMNLERLREASAAAMAWEASSSVEDWSTWVHVLWHPDLLTDVDGFESVSFQASPDSEPERLGRMRPVRGGVQQALAGERLPEHAQAAIVLTRGRVVMDGIVPRPVLMPPGKAWPALDPLDTSPMPRSGQFSAVAAVAMDRSGAVSVLVRPVKPEQARASGLFPPGSDIDNALVPFSLEQGFAFLDRAETPYPWMRHALTGRSGLDLRTLPADPSPTMLSRWLGTLCDTLDLDDPRGGGPEWYDALASIDFYSSYQSWEQVRDDQLSERRLGEWVSSERAREVDLPLFAISFLSAMPAPPVVLEVLRRRLPPERLVEVAERLRTHPELSAWLG